MTTPTLKAVSLPLPLAQNIKPAPPLIDFTSLIAPESPLESALIGQPEFKVGFNWGVPRFGHPEGKVGYHVVEVLGNIDKLDLPADSRQRLRIAAIAHDTFKFQESATISSGHRINHGLLGRRYMVNHIDDEATLDLIELHDEIYYAWRHQALYGKPAKAAERLENLMERIGDHLLMHYLFFRCDTMTGDKIQAPRYWFDQQVEKFGGREFEDFITKT